MQGIRKNIETREIKEKEEVMNLLREQIAIEGKLARLYEKSAATIQSKPVRNLLHTIQLDSLKHIDICQTVLDILQGEDVLKEEKNEFRDGLSVHLELERDSIKKAEKMLKNIWIAENQAANELIKKLRDDEKRHAETLKKLSTKTFFRLDPNDMTIMFRDSEWVEKRYKQKKEIRSKLESLKLKRNKA